MSRIGRKPIEIPEGVAVSVDGSEVVVKGQKGELAHKVHPQVGVKLEGTKVVLEEKRRTKDSQAYWGTTRALIANMIEGVTKGFEKKLELVGVGYRVRKEGDTLVISIGYSHPVRFKAPLGIDLEVEENNLITIKGVDKQLVGLTAANIRKIRKPEPYKGKGIKYIDEVIKRKPGKAGKALGA